MNKKDNIILSILTVTSFSSLIIILIYFCSRIIKSIVHTFVYLTGLVTVLLTILFYLAIILFFINKLYKRYKSCKRSHFTVIENLNFIIETESIVLIKLIVFFVVLNIINIFI